MKRLGVAMGLLCAGYVAACGARSEILDREGHAAPSDDEAGTVDGSDDATDAPASQDTGPADGTGSEQPLPPPFRVVATTPASSATDVDANANLVVRFSTNVTAESLGGAVTLSGGGGAVSGSLSTAGMTATFTPDAPLPLACTESAAVAASATDAADARLGAAYRWQFTTADGAWGKQDSVSGTTYKDGGDTGSGFNRVGIATDGSAFIAWSAYDTSVQHLYLHGSRYTPGSGWTPHLQFGEILQRGVYGGGNLMQAVSANGEAMFLWDGPVIGDAGAAVHQLEWLRYGTDWDSSPGLLATDAYPVATGADASGNFFAVWVTPATGGVTRNVRMARYAHGSGWGTVESPSNVYTGSGTVSPQSASIAVAPDGHAIVAWIDGNTSTGPWWIRVERYAPATGWGGVEVLASGTTQLGSVGVIDPAIGSDGTAALVWRQVGATGAVYKTMVSTFSGTWSAPTALVAGTSSTATQTFSSVAATDGRGTFVTVWTQRDNGFTQVYASRLATKSSTWGTPTLLRGAPMDAGAPTTQETAPQVAMGPTGDAVVAVREYDYSTGMYGIDAVTYSPSAGWSSPTRLETDTNGLGPPLVDSCGNATLVWTRSSDISVWSARQVHGGSWTTPARLDTPSLAVTNGLITDAVGPNGEVMASWTSQQGYSMAAATLR